MNNSWMYTPQLDTGPDFSASGLDPKVINVQQKKKLGDKEQRHGEC